MNYLSLLEDFRQMNILFEGIDDMKKQYENNNVNISLEEVTNAERKGYGEKQCKQYNPSGQKIDIQEMNLSPLEKNDIYVGHHLYGKHEGKCDVVIPRSIHNKINDRVSEEMNKYAKKQMNIPDNNRNDDDLQVNSALNELSAALEKLQKYRPEVGVNIDVNELRKQVGTQYIQDVLNNEYLRQQLYIKVFIDEFYEELQSSNKIHVNDCGKDKIDKYKNTNGIM